MRRLLALAGITVVMTGCTAYHQSHDYNLPQPTSNEQPKWTRVWTPGNYPTLIRTCDGPNGIYVSFHGEFPMVVPNDPKCVGTK